MEINRAHVSLPLYSESHPILCRYSNKKITRFVFAVTAEYKYNVDGNVENSRDL
jgi:hypothetical protein